MNHGLFSLSSAVALALFAAPLAAWADHNPDFDDDAKPILRMQPGLLQFVEATYQVRDTGMAKIPGDEDRHAMPPYIFLAKPRGYPGDYYITLLIQPGPPGHILKVVDPTKPHGGAPPEHSSSQASISNGPPPQTYQSGPQHSSTMPYSPASQAPAPQTPATQAPAQPQPAPTSETPSGPITSSTQPSLEPPPDPPPATH